MRKYKKCLITGITGSGGSYLCEHIVNNDKNIKLFGTYRSEGYIKLLKKNCKNRVKFFKCDLRIFNQVSKVIRKIKPDLIFHIASNADVRDSFDNPRKFYENNNKITENILEVNRIYNSKTTIIICSSSEVYGNLKKKDMPITEDQKINPINPYAVTKAYQDLLSQMYCKTFGMNIIITRMFSYSNARRLNLFQTSFAKQIIDYKGLKNEYLMHGNLKSVRTFIDIKDAMNAYWLAATKGKLGEIYNICGNKTISVEDYLKELIMISGKKIKTKLNIRLLRKKDITVQIGSSAKFIKDTGWKPKISFRQSVKNLLEDTKKNFS